MSSGFSFPHLSTLILVCLSFDIFLLSHWLRGSVGDIESLDELTEVYTKISNEFLSVHTSSNTLHLARFSMLLSKLQYRQGNVTPPYLQSHFTPCETEPNLLTPQNLLTKPLGSLTFINALTSLCRSSKQSLHFIQLFSSHPISFHATTSTQ